MAGIWIVIFVATAGVSFVSGWFLRQRIGQIKLAKAAELAEKYIEEAKVESDNYKKEKVLEAREEIFQLKQKVERELKQRQGEFHRLEKQLSNRELNLDRKVDVLNKKENNLNKLSRDLRVKQDQLRKEELELDQLVREENAKLERISGLSTEEAKEIQMRNMLEKAKQESAEAIREIREEAKKAATREAREIIMQALERSAINHVVNTTVSLIKLPDDEMKGRIIGREGRNIRAFEAATGVEVLIDDTPQTVVLSGFDSFRREIAKQAMEKLIYDGRIHPGRIEEVVAKTEQEIDEKIFETGEQTIQDVGLHGMHHELIRLLGKQQFRTTYGQNLLQHSCEVAILAGGMASLLGLDVMLAKRAGLLHDIGKAAEEYGDAPFYEVGTDLAKKFGENEIVQDAIASQAPGTDDSSAVSPITILVKIADGLSVSRPGAQKEMLESYIKRMKRMEEICKSFSGVINSYAIQAGRELRVLAEHTLIDDNKAQILADNIVQRLKSEMQFPGQIRVTVIREYRSIDYAK
ncbi:MAG: ribonuclease Y [bacterium]